MLTLGDAISLSIAPTNHIMGKRSHDLPATIELMGRLVRDPAIDGFEFQNLADWDARAPIRDEGERRFASWRASPKYTVRELATIIQETRMPILSVHANRDIGILLCSDQPTDIERGRALVREGLCLADMVGSPVCVFHLWDTRSEVFEPGYLHDVLTEIASHYPRVKAAVENVPTHLPGYTPFDLVKAYEWLTLDLRWAALYGELDRFEALKERIANVHLSGRLEGARWVQDDAPFGFYEAVDMIRNTWGYHHLWTLEPRRLSEGAWENLLAAMSSLRGAQQSQNLSERGEACLDQGGDFARHSRYQGPGR